MAVQRLSLTNIQTEILRIVGNYTTSNDADWRTDANLYQIINRYGQSLTTRVAAAVGLPSVSLPMYRTTATSGTAASNDIFVTASSPTIFLPINLNEIISLYDVTNKRPLHPIRDVDLDYNDVASKVAGVPDFYELLDFVDDGSGNWRQKALLHPAPHTGITPSLRLKYYRLPAVMPGDTPQTEYPDADVKYHSLWIYGPVVELMAPNSPIFDRYVALERGLLMDLARAAATS
jgi:hypothetical protein